MADPITMHGIQQYHELLDLRETIQANRQKKSVATII